VHVVLQTTFRANKKEPLAELLERIHAAFIASGLCEPALQFSFSDAPVPGFVSSVDRVLKRHPDLNRFVSTAAYGPNGPPIRQISNGPGSPAQGESVEFPLLLAVAGGVPRSFPFHNLSVRFQEPAFGAASPLQPGLFGSMTPGIVVTDSWWVNGRQRSLSAVTWVEADPASKKLPSPSVPVATVLAACGKAKSMVQIPLVEHPPASAPAASGVNPEASVAVGAIVRDYRAALGEAIDRAALPHDLPPSSEARRTTALGQTTGPKKPVLLRAFKPMGYDCTGGSGTFTLRRRTAGNLTVEVSLDVGTWSRQITAGFLVQGLGFRARLPLPVSKRDMGGVQYPIGDAAQWQRIVENLAALVAEFDRSFVPAVEAAAGPSPEWHRPKS
jgi:hypothetical protein